MKNTWDDLDLRTAFEDGCKFVNFKDLVDYLKKQKTDKRKMQQKMRRVKATVIYILLGFSYFSYGQSEVDDTIRFDLGLFGLEQKIDSAEIPICKIRGHVSGGVIGTTLMYCTPYLIETDTTTIRVYPACNYISYKCLRCRQTVSELETERREVIWRKEK